MQKVLLEIGERYVDPPEEIRQNIFLLNPC